MTVIAGVDHNCCLFRWFNLINIKIYCLKLQFHLYTIRFHYICLISNLDGFDLVRNCWQHVSILVDHPQVFPLLDGGRNSLRWFGYLSSNSVVHSPTFPSLYLRHNSFSNPSVASPTSQYIQHLFIFFYVTSSSLNSTGEPPKNATGGIRTRNPSEPSDYTIIAFGARSSQIGNS